MSTDTSPNKSPRYFLRRTLQVNILAAFAILLIVTVLVIITYTYNQTSTAVLDLSEKLIDQVNDTVIEKTTNYLAPAAVLAQITADLPEIQTSSLVGNADLEQYGKTVLDQYPQLAGIFIGDQHGDFLFVKRFGDGVIGVQEIDRSPPEPIRTWTYYDTRGNVVDVDVTTDFSYDPRERPWYIGASDSGGRYWTDIYIFFTDEEPGITAAYPIDATDGSQVGVVGVDVALDALSEFLQGLEVGENGVAFLINDKAEVVAYPDVSLARAEGDSFRPISVGELEDAWVSAAYDAFQEQGEQRFVYEFAGQRYIGSFTPMPADFGKDWQIVVAVPEDDFIGAIKQTLQISILISVAILAIAIFSAVFISRSISRPIVELTNETERIKDFHLEGNHVITSPIREVQQLSDSIDAMKNGLRAFRRYVPAELVRQLVASGAGAQLGGTQRVITIMFTDVIGFTAKSENRDPQELTLQLSEHLGKLAEVVMFYKGTVDKYMGDGIMAFWGAPVTSATHAQEACRAALEMQQAIRLMNTRWAEEQKPPFPARISIHTGETLVGNLGSERRMNYTLVGESVNLAHRLEALNDFYKSDIIISEETYQQVGEQFISRPLDVVRVRGMEKPQQIYELIAENTADNREQAVFCEGFQRGYDAYQAREWAYALETFRELNERYPHDFATEMYITRCQKLIISPPEADWSPVVHYKMKRL